MIRSTTIRTYYSLFPYKRHCHGRHLRCKRISRALFHEVLKCCLIRSRARSRSRQFRPRSHDVNTTSRSDTRCTRRATANIRFHWNSRTTELSCANTSPVALPLSAGPRRTLRPRATTCCMVRRASSIFLCRSRYACQQSLRLSAPSRSSPKATFTCRYILCMSI